MIHPENIVSSDVRWRVENAFPRLLEMARGRYPGWSSFDHPQFHKDEIGYKRRAASQAANLLAEPRLRSFLDREQFAQMLGSFEEVGRRSRLLYHRSYSPPTGDMGILYREAPAAALLRSPVRPALRPGLLPGSPRALPREGGVLGPAEPVEVPDLFSLPLPPEPGDVRRAPVDLGFSGPARLPGAGDAGPAEPGRLRSGPAGVRGAASASSALRGEGHDRRPGFPLAVRLARRGQEARAGARRSPDRALLRRSAESPAEPRPPFSGGAGQQLPPRPADPALRHPHGDLRHRQRPGSRARWPAISPGAASSRPCGRTGPTRAACSATSIR